MQGEAGQEGASEAVRDGVRHGILSAIRDDVEHRGARTARLLLLAGFVGIIGAGGATLLVSRHPFDHHPSWHVVGVSTVWAGLLVVALAIVLLELRTPTLHLARSAMIGLVSLGLAGICGAICPDQHFLQWFHTTGLGSTVVWWAGPAAGALCLGFVTTVTFAGISSFLLIYENDCQSTGLWLPAAILFALLLPGVVLQAFDLPLAVLGLWLIGTAGGAVLGVAGGTSVKRLLTRRRQG